MMTVRDLKAEMLDTCHAVTTLAPKAPRPPAQIVRGAAEAPEALEATGDSRIEPWVESAFHALTHASETGEPFALIPCLKNGEPCVLLAAARPAGRGMHVMPLFVAVDPAMSFAPYPEGD